MRYPQECFAIDHHHLMAPTTYRDSPAAGAGGMMQERGCQWMPVELPSPLAPVWWPEVPRRRTMLEKISPATKTCRSGLALVGRVCGMMDVPVHFQF